MYRCKLKESQGVIRQTIDMIHGSLLKNSKIESLHCKRVASLCREIALAMGFSQAMADEMEVAGLLHDIGKIGIPKAILEKEGILTPAEWSEICRHPEIGYRILSASNETSDIANYILSHHERYDGAGYPTGLRDGDSAASAYTCGCRCLCCHDQCKTLPGCAVLEGSSKRASGKCRQAV